MATTARKEQAIFSILQVILQRPKCVKMGLSADSQFFMKTSMQQLVQSANLVSLNVCLDTFVNEETWPFVLLATSVQVIN